MSPKIHPTAFVDDGAMLEDGVDIGPHCYVGAKVRVGNGTILHSGACIYGPTAVGANNVLFPHAVLGTAPQDLSYCGEETRLEVGNGNQFRENVSVNRGTVKGGGLTRIGDDNLFMACSHVAHDCDIGSQCIVANNVLFAGHVRVEDQVVINGAAAFHHFVSIGRLAYVAGMSRVVHDVPPFLKVEGDPARVRVVNGVGMERRGLSQEIREEIVQLHRTLFRGTDPLSVSLEKVQPKHYSPEGAHLISFVRRWQESSNGRALEGEKRPSSTTPDQDTKG